MVVGTKRTGFKIECTVGDGSLVTYFVDLENAIDAGEILPPPQYHNTSTASSNKPVSVADELIKLKQLLDAGVINQAESDS